MKAKVWLVLILVFVAGFTAGTVITRAITRRYIRQAVLQPDRVRESIEQRIVTRLHLDNRQKTNVSRIISAKQAELKELRREFAPQFLGIIPNADREIYALLTEDQKLKLEHLKEKNRSLFQPR